MKDNEYFDQSLFNKLVCAAAAVALICVIIFVIVGAVSDGSGKPEETGDDFETYVFPDADEPVSLPVETTAEPVETTAAPETTVAPDQSAAETTAPAEADSGLTALPASSAILTETPDLGQTYIDSIIFLGDSTTYGMSAYGVLTGGKETKQVWTPQNGTLTLDQAVKKKIVFPNTGLEITPAEAAEQALPEYLVITLGVNGISFMNEEQFITEYTKLVKSIQTASPNTRIILQSIFPVGSNYKNLNAINNEAITRANTWVLKVAENCGVKYLDTISVLLDSDGWLYSNYQNGDGMHFNAEGYKAVLNYIRTHGYTD